MKDLSKYASISPAFYACYDNDGAVSPPGVRAITAEAARIIDAAAARYC